MLNHQTRFEILKLVGEADTPKSKFEILVEIQNFCEELKRNTANYINTPTAEVIIDAQI